MSEFAKQKAAEKQQAMTPALRLQTVFDAKRDQLMALLPGRVPGLEFERLRELVCVAYADPRGELSKCSADSVFMAAREAISVGLDPVTKSLGQAWLIRYGDQATFQVGYKGYLELAHRSGRVDRIALNSVHQEELETFECDPGAGVLRHPWRPGVKRTKETLVAVYCAVWLKGSSLPIIEILDLDQIEARRKRSRAGKGPWVTDYIQMAKKSAVRALFARGIIPLTMANAGQVADAIERDARIDGGVEDIDDLDYADATVVEDAADVARADEIEEPGEINGITPDQVSEDEWARMVQQWREARRGAQENDE